MFFVLKVYKILIFFGNLLFVLCRLVLLFDVCSNKILDDIICFIIFIFFFLYMLNMKGGFIVILMEI